MSPRPVPSLLACFALLAVSPVLRAEGEGRAEEKPAVAEFKKHIEPMLSEYCFDCHGEGTSKGEVSFDEFESPDAMLDRHDLWLAALKNIRAGLMPPKKKPQPTAEERRQLEEWIKYQVFGSDPKNPDPGRVTVRRLNRAEYRNTIRDLMGVDFQSDIEFPPDDTGYGFDNIGDVLSVSPMLLEKYLGAARAIVSESVPTVSRVAPVTTIEGARFRREEAGDDAEEGRRRRGPGIRALTYYEPATVGASFDAKIAGTYQLEFDLGIRGNFDFDPGKCRVVIKADDRELLTREFGWADNKTFKLEFTEKWKPGERRLTFELQPLTPVEKKINSLDLQIVSLTVRGPMEEEHWERPPNYERFFTGDEVTTPEERRANARAIFQSFATKAFRRPVDERTVERLCALAESVYTQPGKTYEAGVAHALVAVLASPRFLFRVEESETPSEPGARFAYVDEYSLASRLSYFLWSTMPDEELLRLAGSGELRKNLRAQVQRMMADARSNQMMRNFTGQWLETRDVAGISINARVILARDRGDERQVDGRRRRIRELIAIAEELRTPEEVAELQQLFSQGRRNPVRDLEREVREAMQRETEMFFTHIVREDRPVTELIESDYTFLNERLARHYGIPDVTGAEMRRVTLPPESPRGGVLTHGSVLVVTSNPDRTSPVKRGLFVLENFLGLPAPPPPANIPALEAAEADFKDHSPTLRQALELHREQPLCAGCHQRMDPIGLAFENFNAMGMWREKERGQDIDTAGQLVTGETFNSVRELKRILVNDHRTEFHHCLTEKLLTFAIGRGLDYYDVETVDQIVHKLDARDGRFSALLFGIIDSAPFQKQRLQATSPSIAETTPPSSQLATQTSTP